MTFYITRAIMELNLTEVERLMELKDRLKKLRKDKGITQESLGAAIHVSRSAIAKWEAGLGIPSEDSIVALCAYFSVAREDLFPNIQTEELLVKKNVKINWHKRVIVILAALLARVLALVGGVRIYAAARDARAEAEREGLYPVVTKIYFENDPLSESFVDKHEGKYMLYLGSLKTLYFAVDLDERLCEDRFTFTVELEGVETLPQAELVAYQASWSEGETEMKRMVYRVRFRTSELSLEQLALKKATYVYQANSARAEKECVLAAAPLPVCVYDEYYATVDIRFHAETLLSLEIPKGMSIEETILDKGYQSELVDALLEEKIYGVFDAPRIAFKGWKIEDGRALTDKLYEDAVLLADMEYTSAQPLEVTAGLKYDGELGLYDDGGRICFYLNGEQYGNVLYTLSSESENVEIVGGGRLRGTKPGVATIDVAYDLGFYKGKTSFDVTFGGFSYVDFYVGGYKPKRIKLAYDGEMDGLLFEGEEYEELLAEIDGMNEAFEVATGYARTLKGFQRVDELSYMPVFETAYEFDASPFYFQIASGYTNVSPMDIPEQIVLEVGKYVSWVTGMIGYYDGEWDAHWVVDDPLGILSDNRKLEEAGSLKLYCMISVVKDGIVIFSDIYSIDIVAV